MFRHPIAVSLFMALTPAALAAPITVKEIDLLVRMKVPDAEILQDVETRRLLAPIDAEAEILLRKDGASAALIEKLKRGTLLVPKETALSLAEQENVRVAAVKAAREQDERAFQAQRQRQFANGLAAQQPAADNIRKALDGRLLRLENGTLRPFSADELKPVRIFAFYYSAFWCGPCRKFTPQLVQYYRELKTRHPEFELIFVSGDYNPASMQTYMEKTAMPFPAVKYEEIEASGIKRYAGSSVPWLALVDAAGQPLSANAATKQYEPPVEVLNQLVQLLARNNTPAPAAAVR